MAGFQKGHKKLGGRKPGTRNKTKSVAAQVRKAAAAMKVTPLEYMLAIVNDPNADPERRDRMAAASAPYVHARLQATVAKVETEVTVISEEEKRRVEEQRRREAVASIIDAFWETPRGPVDAAELARMEAENRRRCEAEGLSYEEMAKHHPRPILKAEAECSERAGESSATMSNPLTESAAEVNGREPVVRRFALPERNAVVERLLVRRYRQQRLERLTQIALRNR